jgi:hypothetical protein
VSVDQRSNAVTSQLARRARSRTIRSRWIAAREGEFDALALDHRARVLVSP